MTATAVALPRLGTTLFSFTLEMRQPGYTLAGMIAKVAELGLGPGLEMVGFQSLRGYPRVSGEVVSSFRDQCERTGLEPSAMSMNLDLGIHRGRLLDEDEALDYL
jgi:sugar phosphate isomerase/epimerase